MRSQALGFCLTAVTIAITMSGCKQRGVAASAAKDAGVDPVDELIARLEASAREFADQLAMDQKILDRFASDEGFALGEQRTVSRAEIQARIQELQAQLQAQTSIVPEKRDIQNVTEIMSELDRLAEALEAASPEQVVHAGRAVNMAGAAAMVQARAQTAQESDSVGLQASAATGQDNEATLRKSYPARRHKSYSGDGEREWNVGLPSGYYRVVFSRDGSSPLWVNVSAESNEGRWVLIYCGFRVPKISTIVRVDDNGLYVKVQTTGTDRWSIDFEQVPITGDGPLGNISLGEMVGTGARYFNAGDVLHYAGSFSSDLPYSVVAQLIPVHPKAGATKVFSFENELEERIDATVTIPRSGFYAMRLIGRFLSTGSPSVNASLKGTLRGR